MPFDALTQPDNFRIQGQVNIVDDFAGNAGKINSDFNKTSTAKFSTDGAGNITATSIAAIIAGALQLARNTGTAPTLASNGIIATAQTISRVTTGGAVTGAIMSPGTLPGQICIVINESANTITMATAATSNVQSGTTNVIVANGGAVYAWDDLATTPRWYCVGMGL